jgi:hypothetical protein
MTEQMHRPGHRGQRSGEVLGFGVEAGRALGRPALARCLAEAVRRQDDDMVAQRRGEGVPRLARNGAAVNAEEGPGTTGGRSDGVRYDIADPC